MVGTEMTDDEARDEPRDEELGARLGVPALDDVTRHRLVSTAMRTSRPARTGRWLAAAAAVLVLVIAVAVVVVVAPGSNDDRQAATPARTPARTPSAAPLPPGPNAAAVPAPAAEPVSGSAVDIGDFGDLSRSANLVRLRRTLAPATGSAPSAPTAGAASARSVALLNTLATRPCRTDLPAGPITAVGTGTLDHRRAIIVVITSPNGTRVVNAVLGNPCAVRPLS
jgi:hypothetical protein